MVLIEGDNGTGKSSILEALYYGCYLRSFRTSASREIVSFLDDAKSSTFFVKIELAQSDPLAVGNTLYIGYSRDKKVVKIDQKTIISHTQLLDHYRVISVCEDDLFLIKGSPQYRRLFIDQMISLTNQDFSVLLRDYKTTLSQRNALIAKKLIDVTLYDLWTQQLWEKTRQIQKMRIAVLEILESSVNTLIEEYLDEDVSVSFSYVAARKSDTLDLETFKAKNTLLQQDESRFFRSLFGVHLDDIAITFRQRNSRAYASRGQQKLTMLLIKIAQIQHFSAKHGDVIFLLDDFLVDFDENNIKKIFLILSNLTSQCIITAPAKETVLKKLLLEQRIEYTVVVLDNPVV